MKPFVLDLQSNNGNKRNAILTNENARKMKSGMIHLQSGEDVGEHNTKEKEELIIVLEGRATIEIDGQVFSEVNSGSVVYIPTQTCHNVRNGSDAELRYIYIVTQAE
ncbi:MAG: cupin domain-containing protein [Bacteroidales bacterium]|jgi:quercetin dioxygenase-like cupin family protein